MIDIVFSFLAWILAPVCVLSVAGYAVRWVWNIWTAGRENDDDDNSDWDWHA